MEKREAEELLRTAVGNATVEFRKGQWEAIDKMDQLERHEYYKRLSSTSENMLHISYLTTEEVSFLVSFLESLSYD